LARICSDACREERKRRGDRAYNKNRQSLIAPKSCWGCGVAVPAHRHKCDACRDSSRRARKLYERRRRHVHAEPYTLAEIATRDKFTCGLCYKRVLMDKVVPHPKAPTIDHLIPLSDWGDDVPANVQLAHFICNSIRGAGGTVQLALIG
jgi:hypothetical protein